MPLSEEIGIFKPTSRLYRLLDFQLLYERLESPSLRDVSDSMISPLHAIYSPPFDVFDRNIDVTHIARAPFSSRCRRVGPASCLDLSFRSLCDPVGALELLFDQVKVADRMCTWAAEIRCPERKLRGRKYKLTAEIKGPHELDRKYEFKAKIGTPEKSEVDKKCKWTAEIKAGKREAIRGKHKTVGIKIGEPSDPAAPMMTQAFAKRAGAGAIAKAKGKPKELSPVDAALAIQGSYRAHLIRRSLALRSLRELAVAKAKLREIKFRFNNFAYRRRLAHDTQERKCFSERILALLLTVDAIQGAGFMARATRRSMLDDMEAMLNAVDPDQVSGELGGVIQRRRFHLHEGTSRNEIVAGVSDVIQMLDQAEKFDDSAFEVCL